MSIGNDSLLNAAMISRSGRATARTRVCSPQDRDSIRQGCGVLAELSMGPMEIIVSIDLFSQFGVISVRSLVEIEKIDKELVFYSMKIVYSVGKKKSCTIE